MADLGFLEEIDHSKLPNWTANAADYAVGQWFDPDNTYSLWWQGGITGIGYDPEATGREFTSFEDLLDPEFAGRVGGFSDMRDMFGLTLLSPGHRPRERDRRGRHRRPAGAARGQRARTSSAATTTTPTTTRSRPAT